MSDISNISILSNDEAFLKRLFTFRSCDKVQRAFLDKGVNITLEDVKKIRSIVYDLEENEQNLTEHDREIIRKANKNLDILGYFNEDLYNMFYNSAEKYGKDFFLSKEYYNGETISTGIFTIACVLFELKKKYLKKRTFWEV